LRSLGPLLSALSIKLIAVIDDETLERNRSRYVQRDEQRTKSAKGRWRNQVGNHDGG
jgi:hypothetical protein